MQKIIVSCIYFYIALVDILFNETFVSYCASNLSSTETYNNAIVIMGSEVGFSFAEVTYILSNLLRILLTMCKGNQSRLRPITNVMGITRKTCQNEVIIYHPRPHSRKKFYLNFVRIWQCLSEIALKHTADTQCLIIVNLGQMNIWANDLQDQFSRRLHVITVSVTTHSFSSSLHTDTFSINAIYYIIFFQDYFLFQEIFSSSLHTGTKNTR